MAFEKKTWKARKTEYPNRRMLTLEDGSTELVTVAREEGIISEEGDAFSPENMNGLETRIEKEFTALGKSVSDGKKKVAGAITAQGVSTAADATFDTMAANITAAGTARYNAGRTQGRKDVTSSPNTYNLYTKAQYDANYSKGVTAADNRANPNSVNYKTGYNAGYAAGNAASSLKRKSVSQYFSLPNLVKDYVCTIDCGVTIKGIESIYLTCSGSPGVKDAHINTVGISGTSLSLVLANGHNAVAGVSIYAVVLY